MGDRYSIEFCGELVAGHRRDEVLRRLAEILQLDEDRARQLCSGQRMAKRNLTKEGAAKYQETFLQAGAVLNVTREGASPQLQPGKDPGAAPVESPVSCPKCGVEQVSGEECGACGVVVSKYCATLESGGADSVAERAVEMTCASCGALQPAANQCQSCGAVTWIENPLNQPRGSAAAAQGPSAVDGFRKKYNRASLLGIGIGLVVLAFGAVPFAWCLASGWFLGYAVPVIVVGALIIARSL